MNLSVNGSMTTGSCLCSGKCMLGGTCTSYPNGRLGGCQSSQSNFIGYNHLYDPEIQSLKGHVNAQENSINHAQRGIEKCFEWLEKIDPSKTWPNGAVPNIFEFVAVDAKRRDDIRHVKNALYEFYVWILSNVQDNKWRSKGIECLEDAAMWLNKSISRRKDNGT